jgi:hypothetical protein
MHDAPVFIHSGRPFLPFGAPTRPWRPLVLHVAARGGVDGVVNSENGRLISTNDRLIFTISAFLGQKRLWIADYHIRPGQ